MFKKLCLIVLQFLLVNVAIACPKIDGVKDVNCDGRLTIVCFGDSITAGYGDPRHLGYPGRLNKLLPHARIINLGKGGEKTPSALIRAEAVLPPIHRIDYFILLEGINDPSTIPTMSMAVQTRNNLLAISGLLPRKTKVLLGSLIPNNEIYYDSWVDMVNYEIAPYVRINFNSLGAGILSADGLHPSAFGYKKMADLVYKRLKKE